MFKRASCLLMLVLCAPPALAGELKDLDRAIAKEPAYESKEPRYCLLVFGPDAKMKVWLVLDGDKLHVDRNGNGDLTDKDEAIAGTKKNAQVLEFKVGDIKEGSCTHTGLLVTKFGDKWNINVKIDGKRTQYSGQDSQGALAFAAKSKDAPVIHFNGPLELSVRDAKAVLDRGDKGSVLGAVLGTPGLGKGTLATSNYDGIDAKVHPRAEIEFPAKDPKGTPIKAKVDLANRARGNRFEAAVKVPEEAGEGKAKITFTFADWKEGKVVPATVEVPVAGSK